MKAIGQYKRYSTNEKGNMEVTFELTNSYYKLRVTELEKDKDYSIHIDKIKSKRSQQQNKYMWALLGQIAVKLNNDNDDNAIYCMVIEQYGLKFEYMGCLPKAAEALKTNGLFRVVKFVEERDKFNWYKCYYGSSHYNKEEMIILIDGILQLAHDCGLEKQYWKELLNG